MVFSSCLRMADKKEPLGSIGSRHTFFIRILATNQHSAFLGWQCALFDETGLCVLGVEPLIDYPFMSPNSPVQASCAERDKQVQDLSAIMLPAVIERR